MAAITIAATAATTPTDMTEARAAAGTKVLALGVFGVGLLLVALAAPRVAAYGSVARWSSLVPEALNDRTVEVDPQRFVGARSDYCEAAELLSDDALLGQECARLAMRIADTTPDDAEAARLLGEAKASLKAAAAKAPDRAFLWSLLAAVEGETSAPGDRIALLLRTSYLTGPQEPSSITLRPRIALKYWDAMPDDIRADAGKDIRAMWLNWDLSHELQRIYLASDFRRRAIIRNYALLTKGDRQMFDDRLRAIVGIRPR